MWSNLGTITSLTKKLLFQQSSSENFYNIFSQPSNIQSDDITRKPKLIYSPDNVSYDEVYHNKENLGDDHVFKWYSKSDYKKDKEFINAKSRVHRSKSITDINSLTINQVLSVKTLKFPLNTLQIQVSAENTSENSSPIKFDTKRVNCSPDNEKISIYVIKKRHSVSFIDQEEFKNSLKQDNYQVIVTPKKKNESNDLSIDKVMSKIRHNRFDDVLTVLSHGFDVQTVDKNGNNMLHICCQNNHKKLATVIINHGCNINACNNKGYTPLDYCYLYKFYALAEWIESHGGEVTKDPST